METSGMWLSTPYFKAMLELRKMCEIRLATVAACDALPSPQEVWWRNCRHLFSKNFSLAKLKTNMNFLF